MTQPINNNIAYGLSQPLIDVFPSPIISPRSPATTDKAKLGAIWINTTTNQPFMLVSLSDNMAIWIPLGFGSLINFVTDSGTAHPISSTLNLFGSGSISTSGAGNTVTINGSGGSGGMIVTKFTSSNTWTKNISTVKMIVFGWNGGQGGGSGRRSLSTDACGGGGGCPTGGFYYESPASFFGATETVTIGAGSLGGAPVTVDDTDGNAAANGGQTSFGNLLLNNNSGVVVTPQGGTDGFAAGGSGATFFFVAQTNSLTNAVNQGGGGQPSTGLDAVISGETPNFNLIPNAGGGGSGANSGGEQQAGIGGSIVTWNSGTPGPVIVAGGLGGLESISINGGNGNPGAIVGGLVTGGSGGGGGGGQSIGPVAGNGGNGGIPGGGGGGGGGSLNGTNSGAGGNGARGEVWVLEFFS